jgi:WD40 repeat protein
LAATPLGGAAYLWDLEALSAPTATVKLADENDPLPAIAFGARGTLAAIGREDGSVELWDLTLKHPPAPVQVRSDHSGAVRSLAFALDDRVLFSVHAGGLLQTWDLLEGDSGPIIPTRADRVVQYLLATPDGRWVLVIYDDTSVEKWSADQAGVTSPERTYAYEYHLLGNVGVSPNGRWLAVGTHMGQVRLWPLGDDAESAEPILLPGHEGAIVDLAFDREGRRLFTASSDGTVRIWDIVAPDPAREPWIVPVAVGDLSRRIRAVAFDAARDELIIGGADGTLSVWPLDLDRLIALACTAAGRNLSEAEWSRYSIDTKPPVTCPGKP